MRITGECLCGSVQVELEFPNSEVEVAACHCNMCRNWTSGPMFAIDSGNLINIKNETSITRYQSSEWAQRGFCNKCGTNLFYYLLPADHYHFSAGLFKNSLNLNFSHQIFIDEKPDYYIFSNETHNMTGAEVFSQFENESDT